MNILFLSIEFNYACGISRHVLSLARGLRDRGHRVIVSTPGGSMVSELAHSGIEFIQSPIYASSKSIVNAWQILRMVHNSTRDASIDIIHTHHRWPELLANLASLWSGVPTVTTCHSLVRGMDTLSFRSKRVIAVSNTVKDDLIRVFAVAEERIRTIRNSPRYLTIPLPHDVADFRSEHSIRADEFVIGGIGRLHKEKGFDLFVEAARHSLAQKLPFRWIIAGTGPESNALATYCEHHRLPVILLGEMTDVEVVYAASDVIVVPSRNESAGMVPLEAAMFVKPIIATSVGGLPEIVQDGTTGLLVAPGDALSLANAVERFYFDARLRKKCAEGIATHVSKYYSLKTMVDGVEGIYQELLLESTRS